MSEKSHSKIDGTGIGGRSCRFEVERVQAGMRLDAFLAMQIAELSRSSITALIQSADVLVAGEKKKANYRIRPADEITVDIPPPQSVDIVPEQVDFSIIYEDDFLAVITKPPGLVVHPGSGHSTGTLVHGLLYACEALSGISGELRPGIVHRLDKDTSGVMVVAKNDLAHQSLVNQFKERQVKKVYHALAQGGFEEKHGRIVEAIGRHPVNRKKMAVLKSGGRYAATEWRIAEEFASRISLIELHPETGRTHQIRVHLAHIGHPIVGDSLYGGQKDFSDDICAQRQCLHASSISFVHPRSGKSVKFKVPLWQDMADLVARLRNQSVDTEP